MATVQREHLSSQKNKFSTEDFRRRICYSHKFYLKLITDMPKYIQFPVRTENQERRYQVIIYNNGCQFFGNLHEDQERKFLLCSYGLSVIFDVLNYFLFYLYKYYKINAVVSRSERMSCSLWVLQTIQPQMRFLSGWLVRSMDRGSCGSKGSRMAGPIMHPSSMGRTHSRSTAWMSRP